MQNQTKWISDGNQIKVVAWQSSMTVGFPLSNNMMLMLETNPSKFSQPRNERYVEIFIFQTHFPGFGNIHYKTDFQKK